VRSSCGFWITLLGLQLFAFVFRQRFCENPLNLSASRPASHQILCHRSGANQCLVFLLDCLLRLRRRAVHGDAQLPEPAARRGALHCHDCCWSLPLTLVVSVAGLSVAHSRCSRLSNCHQCRLSPLAAPCSAARPCVVLLSCSNLLPTGLPSCALTPSLSCNAADEESRARRAAPGDRVVAQGPAVVLDAVFNLAFQDGQLTSACTSLRILFWNFARARVRAIWSRESAVLIPVDAPPSCLCRAHRACSRPCSTRRTRRSCG
jgi:hypothetical protein